MSNLVDFWEFGSGSLGYTRNFFDRVSFVCIDIPVNIFDEAERVLRKIQWVHDFYAIGSSCLKMDTKLGAVGAAIKKVDEFIYRDARED
jgi:hypothetical protein